MRAREDRGGRGPLPDVSAGRHCAKLPLLRVIATAQPGGLDAALIEAALGSVTDAAAARVVATAPVLFEGASP